MTAEKSEKHPPGLYVLFFTEMWERFGFYSMLAMFTLYLKTSPEKGGFGWTAEEATKLYSNYLMFVYASPLIGGWIADKKLGYRNSVLIGGLIFMVGYFLLAIHAIWAVYAALLCLVVGNGFFKPNVSAMVGHQYPEGSPLKDRAYNIFYMGINIGALLAPINAEIWVKKIGYNFSFAIAGLGMIISVAILWTFKHKLAQAHQPAVTGNSTDASEPVSEHAIDRVSEGRRIVALLVIFGIVIVFWMIFHQNGSTLTYWADDNTDWKVSGIISNAINPFWVVTLTFPVVWMWGWLNKRDLEPSTPTKMMIGMFLVGVAFTLLYFVARSGETQEITPERLAVGDFRITDRTLGFLKEEDKVPREVIEDLKTRDGEGNLLVKGKKFSTDTTFEEALNTIKQDLAARVTQATMDLKRNREEDKALQQQLKDAREEAERNQLAAAIKALRERRQALEKRKEQAENDVKALKDARIEEGELPPLAERGSAGNAKFREALEKVLQEAKGLSAEGAARAREMANQTFSGREKLNAALQRPSVLGVENAEKYAAVIEKRSYLFKVSPFWLIFAYAIMTLAELMLSPMGLALVSKVAPVRLRGLMMGGWFVATAIGNKLTAIGVYWEVWLQSSFFIVLAGMAAFMGLVLLILLRPLKSAMPGV